MKIDGRQIAAGILENLKPRVEELKDSGITPTLAIILIGNNESSKSYIRQKKLKADEIGVDIKLFHFESTSQSELLELINKLNIDPLVNGVIVQRPLPQNLSRDQISKAISPEKDIDGFNPEPAFDAPVALAVVEILRSIGETDLSKRKIVVIGKGETAGGPVIRLLLKQGLNPTVIDSSTINPQSLEKQADILISAVGKERVFLPDVLSEDMVLIGIGLFIGTDGKLHGDYEDGEVENEVRLYTPTVGGVGPVNVACLMKNLIKAAQNQLQ